MDLVFGHIEVSPAFDGFRWVRDTHTNKQKRVPVEVISRLAARWFERMSNGL